MLEDRKKKEIEFHDTVRSLDEQDPSYEFHFSRRKFYSVTRKSREYFDRLVRENCAGKRVLDYGCGEGDLSVFYARNGGIVTGIDISEVGLQKARQRAAEEGLSDRVEFVNMDCENLEFADDSFDLICESGVLHHLDVNRAYPSLARVLRPDGKIICNEALGHNLVIQLYRRMTPQQRTAWEADHILRKREIHLAKRYFSKVDEKFFHLCALLAVPFRNSSVFGSILGLLEHADSVLLSLPLVKWQAWQTVFVLAAPNKSLVEGWRGGSNDHGSPAFRGRA